MSNTPPADDDILELTDVVEPGNVQPEETPKPHSAPAGDPDLGADFGVDLDALLDSLGAESQGAAKTSAPAPSPPTPAPIADPIPVTREVDPDEELTLPELSDIDSLLQELGVANPAAAQTAPAAEPAAPAPEAPAKSQTIMDDLPDDLAALLAEAESKSASPAPPAPAPAPAPVPEPASAASSGNDGIDLNELDALLDDMLAAAPAPGPAPTAPAPAEAEEATPENIPAASAPSAQAAGLVADLPPPLPAALEPSGPDPVLAARLDALEKNLAALTAEREAAMPPSGEKGPDLESLLEQKLNALTASGSPLLNALADTVTERALAAMRAERETAPAPPEEKGPDLENLLEQKLSALTAPGSPLPDALADTAAERALAALRAERETALAPPEEKGPDLESLLEQKLSALTAPDSPLLGALADTVAERVLAALSAAGSQEETDARGTLLRRALDRSAAAAAAKVIREEIAALLRA